MDMAADEAAYPFWLVKRDGVVGRGIEGDWGYEFWAGGGFGVGVGGWWLLVGMIILWL